jgi:hypothetical protein
LCQEFSDKPCDGCDIWCRAGADARAAAAFRFHLDIHLDKEDTHLYRIFRERISLPEQGKALGIMAGLIPQERFPEVVT